MAQATPATRGGTNRGNMPALAISPFQGVLVRTTIQAKDRPMKTAITVPPPHAIMELSRAFATLGLVATVMKLPMERSASV